MRYSLRAPIDGNLVLHYDTIALKRERLKGRALVSAARVPCRCSKTVYRSIRSVLLGHSSVRITERHYKRWWVDTLQKKLEDEVRKAWG